MTGVSQAPPGHPAEAGSDPCAVRGQEDHRRAGQARRGQGRRAEAARVREAAPGLPAVDRQRRPHPGHVPALSDSPKLERQVSELVAHINGEYGSLDFIPVHH